MKQAPENNNLGLWTGMMILLAVLVLGLFVRRFSIIILLTVSVGLVIGAFYYLLSYTMNWRTKRKLKGTMLGKIEMLSRECSSQIEKYRQEVSDIDHNIIDLEKRLKDGYEINPKSMQESQRLKAAFLREKQLRQTKITFYETCRSKLENMLYNQKLIQELEQKQKRLSQLQEDHYEDLARMEKIRTEVEYEKQFLESISQLSLKMAGTNSVANAEELQLELKEITKEMRGL